MKEKEHLKPSGNNETAKFNPKCTAPDDSGRAGGKQQQLKVSQNDSTLG
jgi:hypothetical protein